MESQEPTCLERMLFDSVRSYARAWELRCDEEQVEAVRDICSTMARFLGRLLESDERWNRYWWIDDVLPTSLKYPAFAKDAVRSRVLNGWADYLGTTRQQQTICGAVLGFVIGGRGRL